MNSTPIFLLSNGFLQGLHINRSRAFFALLDVKAYSLTFLQGPKTLHIDG